MKRIYKKKIISIAGIGRVGTSLALRLLRKKFNVKYLIEKSEQNYDKAVKIFGKDILHFKLTADIIEKSDVIIICTKDDVILKIAEEIAKLNISLNNKLIFHTSGSETSDIFSKLKISSDNIGSIHPVQTFSEMKKDSGKYFSNIYITAEGGRNFLPFIKYICSETGNILIRITPEKKQIYHLICVYVSNYLIGYFKTISDLGIIAGIPEKKFLGIFAPLIETAYNNMKIKGFQKSLTGPIERGDISTLYKHKKILNELDFKYNEIYNILGKAVLEISLSKKSISKKKFKIIGEILRK